jgi:hypothetical protein
MKLGIFGYCPPAKFQDGLSMAFLENLKRFPAKNELILFTDPNPTHPEIAGWPGMVFLKADPEKVFPRQGFQKSDGTYWAINNAVFLTACQMAVGKGFSHMIYLEADCRMGEAHWDEVIYDEFFSNPVPCVAGGSIVCWNPHAGGMESLKRWEDLIVRSNKEKRNFPIPTYGWGQNKGDKVSIFPNGALGVYDLKWMTKFFASPDGTWDAQTFAQKHAWDFVIGEAIWAEFGIDAYDMVCHLKSVYSSFGNLITSEEERLQMLRDHRVSAVHQVKSGVVI